VVSEVIDSDMNFSVFFQVFVGKGGGGGRGGGEREPRIPEWVDSEEAGNRERICAKKDLQGPERQALFLLFLVQPF
jgi:hypothetical protein